MKILIAEDQPPAALYLAERWKKWGMKPPSRPMANRRGGSSARRGTALDLRLDDAPPGRPRSVPAHPGRGGNRYTYIILLTSRDRRDDRLTGLRRRRRLSHQTPDPDELAVGWRSPAHPESQQYLNGGPAGQHPGTYC